MTSRQPAVVAFIFFEEGSISSPSKIKPNRKASVSGGQGDKSAVGSTFIHTKPEMLAEGGQISTELIIKNRTASYYCKMQSLPPEHPVRPIYLRPHRHRTPQPSIQHIKNTKGEEDFTKYNREEHQDRITPKTRLKLNIIHKDYTIYIYRPIY